MIEVAIILIHMIIIAVSMYAVYHLGKLDAYKHVEKIIEENEAKKEREKNT